jgi:hypothetical protein
VLQQPSDHWLRAGWWANFVWNVDERVLFFIFFITLEPRVEDTSNYEP